MFTIEFLKKFGLGLYHTSPILLFLVMLIGVLGLFVGKKEGWKPLDSIYYAFITATTVGYGDFHPKTRVAKFVAIGIAIDDGFVVCDILSAGSAIRPKQHALMRASVQDMLVSGHCSFFLLPMWRGHVSDQLLA